MLTQTIRSYACLETSSNVTIIECIFPQHAGDLPARDYGTPCDPFVRVSLRRDRRSLRKRTKQVLAEFNSEVVKKEANPNFNGEAFRAHINPADYKVRGKGTIKYCVGMVVLVKHITLQN